MPSAKRIQSLMERAISAYASATPEELSTPGAAYAKRILDLTKNGEVWWVATYMALSNLALSEDQAVKLLSSTPLSSVVPPRLLDGLERRKLVRAMMVK